MRKLILSALLVATSAAVFAQNLDDVQEKISKGKYAEAQEQIDKILSNPKFQKNANAWYNKAVVYTNLSLDSTRATNAADYRAQAFEALKRYYELDPKNVMGTLEQNARLWQLYEAYYNNAIKDYNANNFTGSFNNFKNALAVGEFISSKNFSYNGTTLPALDTSLILNTAATALKAQMEDSAMVYYSKLADAKLKDEKYIEIYQMLADYYRKKNDEANRAKYIALGKELYPTNDYWLESELSPLREDKPKLFAKYKELTAANPNSYYLNYNYAVELFNYIYANEKKPEDAATYEPLVEEAISGAIKANNTPEANLLMVRYLTDNLYRTEDSVRTLKGTTPTVVQKKKAMNARIDQQWDKVVPYAEAAFNGYASKQELKASDKGNLKFISNVLVDYYTMKKQPTKAKEYQDKAKELGV